LSRLCRWAQRIARVDGEYYDQLAAEKGEKRLNWSPQS